jgi:hypothetical protein
MTSQEVLPYRNLRLIAMSSADEPKPAGCVLKNANYRAAAPRAGAARVADLARSAIDLRHDAISRMIDASSEGSATAI